MRRSVSLLSVLFLSATCAASDFKELVRKVPQGANAVMAVDVARTLQSPLAKTNGWDKKLGDGGTDRPLYLPPEADKILAAAELDIVREFARDWDVTVFGLTESIPLRMVARAEGGYVDKIEDVEVVWLPSDAYIAKGGENMLVMQSPADRQAIARWINRKKGSEAMEISEYLGVALAAMNREPHVVIALDARNAVQRHRVEQKLSQSDFVKTRDLALQTAVDLIASVQGAVIEITFTDKATAMIRIDFGQAVPFNKTVAKALVLTALEANQMSLPGADSWTCSVVDKSIVLDAELNTDALRRILSLMEPASTKFSSLKDENVEKATGDDMAKLSLAYFKSTQSLMKDLRQKAGSYNSDSYWIDRYATKIDHLPILHVDSDLLDYGENLADTLRYMSGSRKMGRLQAGAEARSARSQGDMNAGFNAGFGDQGYGYRNFAYAGQRANETAAGNAALNAAASGTAVKLQGWNLIDSATKDVRRKMTERYNIEF